MSPQPAWKQRLRPYEAIYADAYTKIVYLVALDSERETLREACRQVSVTNCSWIMFAVVEMVLMAIPLAERADGGAE